MVPAGGFFQMPPQPLGACPLVSFACTNTDTAVGEAQSKSKNDKKKGVVKGVFSDDCKYVNLLKHLTAFTKASF